MNRLFSSSSAKVKAKSLRRNSTSAELKLWTLMRDRRLAGYKFRRQQPIGPYIVDFYSAMVNLAIELDGSGHLRSDRRHLDELRSRYLHEQGIRVVRFLNSELSENIEAVLERILVEVEGRS